eukprot:m51a1_g2210 putative e3 ubiquitin-protein ligase trim23-like (174) ;mRNA; f:188596-189320
METDPRASLAPFGNPQESDDTFHARSGAPLPTAAAAQQRRVQALRSACDQMQGAHSDDEGPPASSSAASQGRRGASGTGPQVPTCAVCLEQFAEVGQRCPYVLHCGHSFCYDCVHNFAYAEPPLPAVHCPTCRELIDMWIDAPKKNYQLIECVAAIREWSNANSGGSGFLPEL